MQVKDYDLKEIEKAVKLLQGFAKAFWGDGYLMNLENMSTNPNPLEYLEQFKEDTWKK